MTTVSVGFDFMKLLRIIPLKELVFNSNVKSCFGHISCHFFSSTDVIMLKS